MTNSQQDPVSGHIRFGTDILPLFALIGLTLLLLAARVLLERLHATTSDLNAVDALLVPVGGLAGTYTLYIVSHVVLLRQKNGG